MTDTSNVDRHLASCAAMAGAALIAGAGMMAAPQDSHAAIYTIATGGTLTTAGGPVADFLLWDLDTKTAKFVDASPDTFTSVFITYPTYDVAMWLSDDQFTGDNIFAVIANSASFTYFGIVGAIDAGTVPNSKALSAGYSVGSTATFASAALVGSYIAVQYATAGTYLDYWSVGTPAYVGFKYSKGGTYNYGWIYAYITSTTSMTVGTIAWETTAGTAITTGVTVPEPGSMALAALALGAVGLANWRRRREEDADAA